MKPRTSGWRGESARADSGCGAMCGLPASQQPILLLGDTTEHRRVTMFHHCLAVFSVATEKNQIRPHHHWPLTARPLRGAKNQSPAGWCRHGASVETYHSYSSREINTSTMWFLTSTRQYSPRILCSLCLFDEWHDSRFSSQLQTKARCTDCALRSLTSYWFRTGDCHIQDPLSFTTSAIKPHYTLQPSSI